MEKEIKYDKDGFIVTTQEDSVPKDEQEFSTNTFYQDGVKICSFYTNNPFVARKYEKFVKSDSRVRSEKVYNLSGNLVGLQGVLDVEKCSISIKKKRKKRDYSDEERAAIRERFDSICFCSLQMNSSFVISLLVLKVLSLHSFNSFGETNSSGLIPSSNNSSIRSVCQFAPILNPDL